MQHSFTDFLSSKNLVIFPGGTGTELQRRGYKTTLPLWSAQANEDGFDLLTSIHEDYFKAGADICVTNTFRTTPRSYKKVDRSAEDAHHSLKEAVRAARQAQKVITDRPTFVLGSMAPLEDCYTPEDVPSIEELEDEHTQIANWLAEEKVDAILVETVNSVEEAKYMAHAASQTGLPFLVSFLVDEKGRLLDGRFVSEAVNVTDIPGRVAVGLNCRPIQTMDEALAHLTSTYAGPVLLYPNGFGEPHEDQGWCFHENEDTMENFLAYAQEWYEEGAKIIGGCCGTTPAYIQALSESGIGKED
jgi:homocysteine S-methyltransferase